MLTPRPRDLLRLAYAGNFAMPAFNVCNLEMAKAVVEAAVTEQAPVIVQTYPGDLAHTDYGQGLGPLPGLIQALAAEAPVPVILHLDHGPSFEYDLRCLRAGYNSVMFDGHDLSLEEALAETAGHRPGGPCGARQPRWRAGHLRRGPGQPRAHPAGGGAADVRAGPRGHARRVCGVGARPAQPARTCPCCGRSTSGRRRPVLHGGSGIHDDDVRAAMKLGVVKINIGAALARAWCAGSRAALDAGAGHYEVLDESMRRVREVAQHRLRLMGASGRAQGISL